MTTCYYVRTPPACGGVCADHCKSQDVHVGLSAIGWTFSFRAYPDPDRAPEAVTWPVTDYASWLKLLDLGEIYDEYDHPKTRDELLGLIDAKRSHRRSELYPAELGDYLDKDGNHFIPREFS
jgi:hypothetical protein